MSSILTLCGGFLLAVLWMDLMFDVQVLRFGNATRELPDDVLSSIAAYYRRVTTLARPMSHLVAVMMFIAVLALAVQVTRASEEHWVGLVSLPFCGGPIVLAGARVFPNAVRLGARAGSALEQSRLARTICRDHLLCLGGMSVFVGLQLLAALR